MTSSKVRIYDLAREVKQESKRIIEDARREGVDVSVASNSVPKEVADKIRQKYFPKQEAPAAARVVRVIKKEQRHTSDLDAGVAAHADDVMASTASPTVARSTDDGAAVISKPSPTVRLVKKSQPAESSEEVSTEVSVAPPADAPETATASDIQPPAPTLIETTSEPEVTHTQPSAATGRETTFSPSPPTLTDMPSPLAPPTETVTPAGAIEVAPSNGTSAVTEVNLAAPPSTPVAPTLETPATPTAPKKPFGFQSKVLTLNKTALNEGVRPGERIVVPPAPPSPRERVERSGRPNDDAASRRSRRPDTRGSGGNQTDKATAMRGTQGEAANPQTTYIPSNDSRRPPKGRNAKRPGSNFNAPRDRSGRGFDRDVDVLPQPRTIDERIREAIGFSAGDQLKQIRIVEGSTVKDFAEKLGIKPKDIVSLLVKRGVFATINQPLNDDIAIDLGRQFGFDVSFVGFEDMVAEEEFEELIAADADDVELPRAPVVTVMGHVDHGKTSLLDAIRSANVVAGEAGGITQHIGAYSAYVTNPDNPETKRRVVFLDTPGHEAFTMMRARGAKATDIVVLVVAADDGVMPQTIEAIEHSRAAKVPLVVAINKIDKPDANPDRVKQELAVQGLQPVDWGGDTEMVLVSAKQRQNLDTLLETILLTADILDLKASPTRLSSGVVLEAKLDRGRGSVATVLVQQGTLRVGDPFIVGQVHGKVRAMYDDRGNIVTEAPPATPVEVLGLQGVPQAGDAFQVVADITRAVSISSHRQQLQRQTTLLASTKRGIESLGEQEIKELLVILKADVQGSVEVLRATLEKLSTEKVKVRVILSGVGAITESDVLLASATQATASNTAVVIIGFNVRPETRAAELAKHERVDIRPHSIIYKVEEEIRAAMLGMLDAIEQEKVLGRALVQQVFRVPRVGAVAGCRVISGVVRRTASARLIRDGVVIWEGGIASLRRVKDDVSEVREGFECGIGLAGYNDIKDADEIEVFMIEKIAATEL